MWSLKKFHTYLYGRRFTFITDHQPLTAIFSPVKNLPSMTAARLQRYALLLAGYQYDIVYRKTSDHGNADGLSRLPINSPASEANADGDAVDTFHVSQFDPLPVTAGASPPRNSPRPDLGCSVPSCPDRRLQRLH